MSANGKVLIGFSKPYVAKYTESGGAVSYSDGQILARGVSVSISPDNNDDNTFYADNVIAETVGAVFTGGEFTLTVDGVFIATEKLIYGLPTPDSFTVTTGTTVSMYKYGESATAPYVGIGYIEKWMSGGTTYYTPTILRKCRFNLPEESAETQGEEIDWQTNELSGRIMRDDTTNKDWKWRAADQTTEAAAENIVRVALGLAVLA